MTPGSNILAQALRLIQAQPVTYEQHTGQTSGPSGLITVTYAPPATLYGSLQAVSRNTMALQGLDMTKDYRVFYSATRFREPGRDGAGDRIAAEGRLWQVVGGSNWYVIDGWDAVLLVDVGAAP